MDNEILDGVCLAGPIIMKNAEQRIVTGPVLVPGEKDSDGESVTAKQIERVALKFLESYGNVDVGHSFNNVASVVENWITRTALKFQLPNGDSLDIPEGTWMMSSKVGNDEVWQGVLAGKFKGYSIAGIKVAEIESAMKSKEITAEEFFGAALKRRTLLRDLGEEWVAIAVSIVEDPSVFKSKWIAIKSTETENPLQRLLNRFKNKSNEKTVIKEDNEMEMKEIKAAMKEAAIEAVEQVVEDKVLPRLTAVEDEMKKEPAEKTPVETKTEEKTEEKATDEKSDNVIDMSSQIGVVQEELLKELQADEPDMEKVTKLNAKLETLKEISAGEKKEEKPPDVEALQKEIDELKKKVEDGDKVATKSRADKGQDGGTNTANKDADDGLPNRDARGCVVRKRA